MAKGWHGDSAGHSRAAKKRGFRAKSKKTHLNPKKARVKHNIRKRKLRRVKRTVGVNKGY